MRDGIDRVKPTTGRKIRDYVNFGRKGNSKIKFYKEQKEGFFKYHTGELDLSKKRSGKCITIDSDDGYIRFGYYLAGSYAAGKYLWIR